MGQIPQDDSQCQYSESIQNAHLDHVSQVMGYHPSYLEQFMKTQNFILNDNGPLSYPYRHYIAIMAAGRHHCSYLVTLQKEEFLSVGGDKSWLKGLNYIPQKLKNLYEVNKILAHRPWLFNRSHIEKLTRSGRDWDSWSLAEAVQAMVILIHFHSLCSFVFSSGVNQELCPVKISSSSQILAEVTVNSQPPPSPTVESTPEVAIVDLMQRMRRLSEEPKEVNPRELAKRFEHVEVQSAEIGAVGAEPDDAPRDISCFISDPNFIYQDFAKRPEKRSIDVFRINDYCWNDQGFSTVSRLYNDIGNLLDDKFKTAYNLTYYTMGGRKDVDTSRFRRAIWNYVQVLFGIRHDDYDYGEINALMERSLKAFIKTAAVYPERITKKEYDRVLREFQHSEKVHVNLMVMEARMQSELLYCMRTIGQYLTR